LQQLGQQQLEVDYSRLVQLLQDVPVCHFAI